MRFRRSGEEFLAAQQLLAAADDSTRRVDNPPNLANGEPRLAKTLSEPVNDPYKLTDGFLGLADDSPALADDPPGLADDPPGLADDSPGLADDPPARPAWRTASPERDRALRGAPSTRYGRAPGITLAVTYSQMQPARAKPSRSTR